MHCRSAESCWDILTGGLSFYGVSQISYGGLFCPHHNTDPLEETVFITNFDGPFMENYVSQGHLAHDVAVRWGFVHENPLIWQDPAIDARLTERERDVMRDASAFGVRNGLTLPMRFGREGTRGAMLMCASGIPDREWADMLEGEGKTILAIAHLAHETMQRFPLFAKRINTLDRVIMLTPRERECLLWSAQGCQVGEVADRMKVADRTAEHHLAAARRKLHARTTAQAVARALSMGMLYEGVQAPPAAMSLWESPIPKGTMTL